MKQLVIKSNRIKHRKLFLGAFCSLLFINSYAVTLEEAVESAMKIDPAIRASKLNRQATEENIAIARSRLLPQISLQGSSSQLTQTTTQDMPTGGSTSRSFTGPSVNHQLVMRQALIRPREMSSLRFAELQSNYMELKLKYDMAELKSRVVNAWIDLLGAQQLALAYERPIPFIEAAAKQEQAKFEQGDGTKDAVIEADAQYQYAKSVYLQAVATLKAKQSLFEKLTKLPTVNLLDKKLPIEAVRIFVDTEKIDIWDMLRDGSLEIQMSKLQELMQLEKVRMTEADHKPTLDLLAAINLAQNDATSTQGYQYKNKQLGVQYTLPLYSGGGTSASTRQANLGFEASLVDSETLLARLENDFENTWSQIVGSAIRQRALNDAYLSAMEQHKATSRGLALGIKSISDIASNELTLSRRMADLINNTQEYFKNITKIRKNELLKN